MGASEPCLRVIKRDEPPPAALYAGQATFSDKPPGPRRRNTGPLAKLRNGKRAALSRG